MAGLSLFDPRDNPALERFLTVSQLNGRIKGVLEADFSDIAVRGEVGGLSRPRSGHVYFKLKDESSLISAVLWKAKAARVKFDLVDGLAVRVKGDLRVYEPRGEYQIDVRSIEPEGIGALELAFRQTFERLKREGLFAPERKRPLPRFPRRIVVVTSPTGAAVRDFLQIVDRRWRAVEVLIVPTRVQGDGSALEIAAAIELAGRVAKADVIVVARGGGSLEDLWAFNEEPVARAIFNAPIPVVSAVGHEVDVTIADHVADVRALTPSEAGERCVPDSAELRSRIDTAADRLVVALRTKAETARSRIDRLADRLTRAGQGRIDDARCEIDDFADRLKCAMRSELDGRNHALITRAAQLEALSPLAVLTRGYSLTLRSDGTTVVRRASDLEVGEVILTRLMSGRVASRVESLEETPSPAREGSARP